MDRDIKLSNIKGLLIFLVVLGHLIAPYKAYNVLYLFIYSFHMPLFIFVSGYFAKRASAKKVVNFLLILILFQPLYRFFLIVLNPDKTFNLREEVPYYHLWFLLAMTFWYLLALGIKKLPLINNYKAAIVLIFFIIGLAVRFIAGPFEAFMKNYDPKFISDTFTYMRTLSLLPFFFLGFFISKESMQKIYCSLKGYKLIPSILIIGILLYLMLADSVNAEKIFKGNNGIEQLDGSLMSKSIGIILGYAIALSMCYVLLNIISEKKSFLTRIGDRTLPVYLFHAFLVMVSKKIDFFQRLSPWLLLPVMILSAAAIVFALSSDIFIKYTYYICNPLKFFELISGHFRKAAVIK